MQVHTLSWTKPAEHPQTETNWPKWFEKQKEQKKHFKQSFLKQHPFSHENEHGNKDFPSACALPTNNTTHKHNLRP